jgi:hypothetical protein
MAILLNNECRDIRILLSRTPLASGRPDQPIVFVWVLCGGEKRRVTRAVIGLLAEAFVTANDPRSEGGSWSKSSNPVANAT